jgi:hypothetical protein
MRPPLISTLATGVPRAEPSCPSLAGRWPSRAIPNRTRELTTTIALTVAVMVTTAVTSTTARAPAATRGVSAR